MAFNVGEIAASLSINLRNFLAGLKRAEAAVSTLDDNLKKTVGAKGGKEVDKTGKSVGRLNMSLKDTSRIVSGILISQAFYGLTQQIQASSRAVLTFMNNMAMADIALEYFLGSTERTRQFVTVMKDFAAITPFTTEQAIQLSRRLMAMGFAAKNTRFVMDILTDTAAATGGTAEQMDRIVLALGQMKTNGRIAGQEMRQLAEAGVPAYRILQEEMGLTAEQMSRLGDMRIDGDLGVAAILNGLTKRYSGAAERIAETVPGLWSTVKDDMLIISEEMFAVPYKAMENNLREVRDFLEEYRKISRDTGLGGMFEHLFPPRVQQDIRVIIGGFRELKEGMMNLIRALKPTAAFITSELLHAFAKVTPTIVTVVRTITDLTAAVLNTIPGIGILVGAITGLLIAQTVGKALVIFWRIVGLGTVCSFIAKQVGILTLAISNLGKVMWRNPWIALATIIVAALLYIVMTSKAFKSAMDNIFDSMARFAGIDTSNVLQPVDNISLDTGEQFNEQLDQMDSNLTNVGSEAKKAGKALKNAFSAGFDELYQIPDLLTDTTGALGEVEDLGSMMDVTMPEFNIVEAFKSIDFKSIFNEITGKAWPVLYGFMSEVVKEVIAWSYDMYKEAIKWTIDTIPVFTKWGLDVLNGFNTWVSDTTTSFGTWVTDTYKIFKGWIDEQPLLKWFVDSAIGLGTWSTTTLGTLTTWVADSLLGFKDWYLGTTGEVLAWSVDTIASFTTWSVDSLKVFSTWVIDAVLSFKNWSLDSLKGFKTWAIDSIAELDNWLIDSLGVFTSWVADSFKGFSDWATDTDGTFTEWVTDGLVTFKDWSVDSLLGLATWASDSIVGFNGWVIDSLLIFTNWVSDSLTDLGKWSLDSIEVFTDWVRDSTIKFGDWITDIKEDLVTWGTDTIEGFGTWATDSIKGFNTWVIDTKKGFADWIKGTFDSFVQWSKDVVKSITTWSTNMVLEFDKGYNSAKTAVELWFKDMLLKWSGFMGGIVDEVDSWIEPIAVPFRAIQTRIVGVFTDIRSGIKGILNGVIIDINNLINKINSMGTIEIPSVSIPGTDVSFGGGSMRVLPYIPNISGFERGGLIDRDMLIRAGEGNKREAMVPLENSNYMRPFSAAVASDIMEMVGGGFQNNDQRPIMYVGTLIADDRSLKELERKMEVIRVSENQRKGL